MTPPSSRDSSNGSKWGLSAQFKAKYLQGQDRCTASAEIPVPGLCPAAGRRHRLLSLCPLVYWRGCHTCHLLDIRCASNRDPGQAVFVTDLSAALPGLVRSAFTGEPFPFSSGQGAGEFLQFLTGVASACWGCCGCFPRH